MICIAVVKIWKVKANLKQVVEYAKDKEKTDLSKFNDLNELIECATKVYKT